MLKLLNIKKSYKTGNFVQHALMDMDLEFRNSEFVSILGPSGSGKTTLLNIIGGLDKYDSGDLIINGKSTKKFSDKDWDAYRNNCIGFIFQSYNLIGHLSVLENVEMALTLSGNSSMNKKKKAIEALNKVGLGDHIHKKPNQLSGGQMQRVAIARAIVNNPSIILADEPTGALDSKTSIQIMELIKEIAKDKLVIMVTHNADLAKEYSTRIVELKDGELISDSNPMKKKKDEQEKIKIKKTSMGFFTALKLSFNNIITKKGRTLLTSFASSIGIIGIALILSLSNGFDIQIDKFEKETLTNLPVIISTASMEMSEDQIKSLSGKNSNLEKFSDEKFIFPMEPVEETFLHSNVFTQEYIEYINNINKDDVLGLSFQKTTGLNILYKNNNTYKLVDTNKHMSLIPKNINLSEKGVFEENYDILYGEYSNNKDELVLLTDTLNRVDSSILEYFGIKNKEKVKFEDLIDKEVKLIFNNDYYINLGNHFSLNVDYEKLYNSDRALTLKITAIARPKESNKLNSTSMIMYSDELVNYVIENNKNSDIVLKQKEINYNVLTGELFDDTMENTNNTKDTILSYLGDEGFPKIIYIYPKDFESKENIVSYLDKYNKNKNDNEKITYTDLADTISSLSSNIMDAITIVLIAFSAISLVVSSIMIGIITYISVLERTKEIGILRALGARKKDITRVFNAETFIIGICSGIIGIIITLILLIPANMILENLTELKNVAILNPIHAIILIIVSITLTLLGGWLPAKMASKKDPVIALRTE